MAESGIPERLKAEAYLLPGIGGGVDAIGVLTLGGLFVAHMSGNTAFLGAAFGQGNWAQGLPHLFAVPVFVIGLFLGYSAIVHSPTPRRCACILLVEAALLAVFLACLQVFGDQARNSAAYFLIATPPLLAMGLQNATLRQIGRSSFPSTYVTGVLDLLPTVVCHEGNQQ
nr:YoaK family protein [Terrimicrobiaceae bacterium]